MYTDFSRGLWKTTRHFGRAVLGKQPGSLWKTGTFPQSPQTFPQDFSTTPGVSISKIGLHNDFWPNSTKFPLFRAHAKLPAREKPCRILGLDKAAVEKGSALARESPRPPLLRGGCHGMANRPDHDWGSLFSHSPRLRYRSATPLINAGGKGVQ